MGVNLTKGGNVSLTKAAPGLAVVRLGLGWDARTTDGAGFDLDASAMGLGVDGRIVSDDHFVFYNNKRSPDGAIEHGGDNLTGDGSGDDEVVTVDLAALPTAMVFGELYRNGAEWKFRAIGQGYASGLSGIAQDFGVTV